MFSKVRILPAVLSAGLLVLEIAFMNPARASAPAADFLTVQREVAYGDLNLDRAADAARLYRRIEHAATRVCEPDVSGLSLQAQAAARRCVDSSVAAAVASVSHPNLTAIHAADAGASGHITAKR